MKNDKVAVIAERIISSGAVILEGAISVLSALCSGNSKVSEIILKQGVGGKNVEEILNEAKIRNIRVEILSADEIKDFEETVNGAGFYSIGKTHGGVVAAVSKRRFPSAEELITALLNTAGNSPAAIAVIEGIEDPYNLGYAARALYTQGTDALILPKRDFGFSASIIEKASTGTFSKMPVAVFEKDADAKTEMINFLKSKGFRIYCVNKKSPPNSTAKITGIFETEFADRSVFIIGGEKRGISKDFLSAADEIVRIPYAKEFPYSLAAQTAATVVSYEIHRQRTLKKEKNI